MHVGTTPQRSACAKTGHGTRDSSLHQNGVTSYVTKRNIKARARAPRSPVVYHPRPGCYTRVAIILAAPHWPRADRRRPRVVAAARAAGGARAAFLPAAARARGAARTVGVGLARAALPRRALRRGGRAAPHARGAHAPPHSPVSMGVFGRGARTLGSASPSRRCPFDLQSRSNAAQQVASRAGCAPARPKSNGQRPHRQQPARRDIATSVCDAHTRYELPAAAQSRREAHGRAERRPHETERGRNLTGLAARLVRRARTHASCLASSWLSRACAHGGR